MPKRYSSTQVINALKQNGFIFVSQRGSHAKYRRGASTVIVPIRRKELPQGTFRSILRQSGLDERDF